MTQQLIDRAGMRADLLEMAERAERNLWLINHWMSNVDWASCYQHIGRCLALAAELSREEGE